MMNLIVLIQVFATFFLAGLSWFVQWVHYPLFHYVSESTFSDFHKAHVVRTQVLIFLLLPVEIVTSAMTAIYGFRGLAHSLWVVNFIFVIGICLSTLFIQMPIHRQLSLEKSSKLIDLLVLSHGLRTALWTFRSAFLALVLLHLFKS